MPNEIGIEAVVAEGAFGVVVAQYNESITSKLLEGAVATLVEAGIDAARIDVARVPGAFELPLVADKMAGTGRYSAVLCLGAVIKGETTHDEHINRAVSLAIMESSLRRSVPILFGVLTCDTLEQAIHRAGGNVGNKGAECAQAALAMVRLLAAI